MVRLLIGFFASLQLLLAEPLHVATLHPLLSELVHEIGGDQVRVTDLVKTGQNLHSFSPSPTDLLALKQTQLIVAVGMNFESYLPALQNSLSAPILPVGDLLPARQMADGAVCSDEDDHHDHSAHHHQIDPHWWQSVPLMMRATQVISNQMAQLSPEHAAYFRTNARAYREKLRLLDQTVRAQIASIPVPQRFLATSHAAFGYYCDEYGLSAISLAGITPEQTHSATKIQSIVQLLDQKQIRTVFPEKESNPKLLQALVRDQHFQLGQPLIADATDGTPYQKMIEENTRAIVRGLKP